MRTIFSKLFPIISLCLSWKAMGQVDSNLNEMTLEELLKVKVTTATKTLQEQDIAPAKVVLISKEQIKARNYQSLLDLLYDLPGFKIDDKIYSGSRNSLTIRGIQGQQNFFILLDGVKISSPTNEALPIMENYPLQLAEQVEVVYGPASALYGADAVAGVINIITQKLPIDKKLTLNAATSAGLYGYTNSTLYAAKSWNENYGFVLSGQYCYDKQPDLSSIYKEDTLLSVAHYSTGIFNTIFGEQRPSKAITPKYEAPTTAFNIYGALHLKTTTVSLFSNYTKIPNSWGNNTHNAVYNKDVYMAQSVSGVSLSNHETFNKLTIHSTLTGTYYSLSPKSNYKNLYSGMNAVYKYSMSVSAKIEEQLEYNFSKKVNVIGGVSHERFSSIPQSADLESPVNPEINIEGTYAGTSTYYRPQGIPAQFYHINYHNSGAYIQGQYTMTPKLNFTLGARYDYNSRYKETFNPRLGIVFKASSHTTIKALYGSAFMAPPPSTAFVVYGTFNTVDSGKTYTSSFLHLANPKLGPIRSQNIELSVNHYLTNNFFISLEGYFTQLSGLFTFADDNQTTRLYNNSFLGIPVDYVEVFVNGGKQRNYGGTLQLNYKSSIGNFFFNSYLYANYINGYRYDFSGLNNEYHTELPFISPFSVQAGIDGKIGKFQFSPRIIIMSRQNLPGISDTIGTTIKLQTIPGYALLNLALRYQVVKKLSVFSNISNVLNQKYRAVSYNMDLKKENTDVLHGQPQDPIRFLVGLSLSIQD